MPSPSNTGHAFKPDEERAIRRVVVVQPLTQINVKVTLPRYSGTLIKPCAHNLPLFWTVTLDTAALVSLTLLGFYILTERRD